MLVIGQLLASTCPHPPSAVYLCTPVYVHLSEVHNSTFNPTDALSALPAGSTACVRIPVRYTSAASNSCHKHMLLADLQVPNKQGRPSSTCA